MEYYERSYIGRKTAGSHNKHVKTNDISKYNKNKKYKIYEIINASKYLYHLRFDATIIWDNISDKEV